MPLAAVRLTGFEHFAITPASDARETAPMARGPRPSERMLPFALPGYRPICQDAERRAIKRAAIQRQAQLSGALSQPMSQRPQLSCPQSPCRLCPHALPPAPSVRLGKSVEGHQVLRAIKRQDIVALSLTRDCDLGLLLRPVGHTTPLGRAIRLGLKHASIAIVLVDFFRVSSTT